MTEFNKAKHQLIMGQILRDIYSDATVAPLLGFKGGTCAYFFYQLTRFSVDLDFDLFDPTAENKTIVFEKVEKIMAKYGIIKDKNTKFFTIFFLLSYGTADRNIKVEINVRKYNRDLRQYYEPRDYSGIPMLVAKPGYIFACKLIALTERRVTVMRDIYDVYFFAKNNWSFEAPVVAERTGKSIFEHLQKCIDTISKVEDNKIMEGIGELVEEKEKSWIRKSLRSETIFLLKNYAAAMEKTNMN